MVVGFDTELLLVVFKLLCCGSFWLSVRDLYGVAGLDTELYIVNSDVHGSIFFGG